LPETQPEAFTEEQLRALHHVLMEVNRPWDAEVQTGLQLTFSQMHIEEGNMTCRGCGHVYPISNGIPNMVSSPLCILIGIASVLHTPSTEADTHSCWPSTRSVDDTRSFT
jgi:uncharacterized protein YbaR (Trm112 family)